jgi:hypothetical protein
MLLPLFHLGKQNDACLFYLDQYFQTFWKNNILSGSKGNTI